MRLWSSAAAVVFVSAVLASPLVGQGSAEAQSGCKVAKGDSVIAKACAEGGLLKAKQTMRAMVKQGRAAGTKFDCADCHADEDHHEKLTADAKEKFAKLLAVVQKKK
jgi:hypothetical protein